MFVNGPIFLVTTSFNIKFSPIMNMQVRGANKLSNGLIITISMFTAQKINNEMVVGDKKFEAVCVALRPVYIKIVGSDKHRGHVESLICTVREHTGCSFHKIPTKNCPKPMVV